MRNPLTSVYGRFVAVRIGARDMPADAATSARVADASAPLVEAGVEVPGAPTGVITVPDHSRDLFDRDGVELDDVILLELAG